jgi:hypothetical protein
MFFDISEAVTRLDYAANRIPTPPQEESVAEFGNMRHEKKEKVVFSASTVS